MANPIKQLAGETAVYGLSTILARIINFLFVPFYTRLLTTESYGVVAEFMAYIAVLQVVLVLGLETGCFRFANRENADPKAVYSNALAAVSGISLAFLALMVAFSGPISAWLGYEGYGSCIMYMGGILAMDSITAILFAKLRQEHKALKFALLKTVKIITETVVNILLFFPFASYCADRAASAGIPAGSLGADQVWLLHFVSPVPDFSYVIFAIFVSCVVCTLLFVPSLMRFSFELDGKLLKQMLVYSIPLMVAALPGVLNDFLDRILFRFFDTGADAWRSSVGIYQAAVKISVIMSLFIQMFRFAAEPFFFQRTQDKGSKELYAKVMEYFTAFCGLVFLGVILYIDVISLILGRDFRAGIGIVPIMLLSYMLLGMLFNVSMWYKLSGKTSMAIYITLAGLAVTAVVNIVFMPLYSYWAAAFAHLASYLVMFIISAYLGQKNYPIPYRWGRIALIFIGMGLFYVLSMLSSHFLFPGADFSCGLSSMILKLVFNTALVVLYCVYSYFLFVHRR
ncbi:MAG: oligosaccharide flippase family protein [Bacteroidales bacterium]|nr:oligosaccharide flippase family protein [Bacteroidales bacterium]